MVKKRGKGLKKKVLKKGMGILNTLINKLPFELHIPGYNYCGPGTKLNKRLERGDVGVNVLDEACKEHDISYSESEELSRRHAADERLYKKALARVGSRDAGAGERIASAIVAGLMKSKVKLGIGLRRSSRKRKMGRIRRKRGRRYGGTISFMQAMKRARSVLGRKAKGRSVLDNARIAYNSLSKLRGKKILFPKSRVIPIPRKGGFLPLIPLFAALGALGSLGGGAAAIAKAVNDAKAAKDQLAETERHNRAMETKKAAGSGLYVKPYRSECGINIGRGLYVKPYKAGCGLYLSNGDPGLYVKPYKAGCGLYLSNGDPSKN
ncbi:Phospholipase A2-like domain [Popillia japonica]|uniref:Phospholipase A2-like domain n=1 Tax=Popillia japonica TaxID=7064 RepID=A0AAW1MZY8_POPJA